jgi:hypothetical protein
MSPVQNLQNGVSKLTDASIFAELHAAMGQ